MQELGAMSNKEVLDTALKQLGDKITQYTEEMDARPSFIAHTYLAYYQSQFRILNSLATRLNKYPNMAGNLSVLYPNEFALAESIVGLKDA